MSDAPRIIVTVQHPAHVHFFRNAITDLEALGYDVCVFAREKDIACTLLDTYGIEYETLAGTASSPIGLAKTQAIYEYRILSRVRALKPDVLLAIGEPAVAHASSLVGGQSIIFTDTEHAAVSNGITFPFADLLCTPDAFWDDLGERHRVYSGFHELAYLHPDRFTPDPMILEDLGESDNEQLVVLRLVSWNAAHDFGRSGIDGIETLINELERGGATVLVTAEGQLPPSFADREVDVPPHRMHDLLAAADLFLGESATMAIESGLLGTPALYVSDLQAGVLGELETKYRLLRWLSRRAGPTEIADHACGLLSVDDSTWSERRRTVLEETIDTTQFIVDTVEEVARG
ncbi:DUF354 domain-containing protein [Haloarchaeobius amylolyticus]|uniref:DUF354 domain-containing protein n=2 Tax=Halobacteriales TaxID=2235 RepID=A0A1N7FS03_9EURY|nr:DUF354 domain-containing protein [Natronorubrum thiooxidans]SIS03025.1 hypothetical protein SAMN05421752_10819 [Natronorubrum thiooxidans]